jgi:hypothetical protein
MLRAQAAVVQPHQPIPADDWLSFYGADHVSDNNSFLSRKSIQAFVVLSTKSGLCIALKRMTYLF